MKNFLLILCCLICLGVLSSCGNKQDIIVAPDTSTVKQNSKEEIAAILNDSVFCISVVLKGSDSEKKISVGTGFLISENLLATAFHVQTRAEDLSRYFKAANYKIVVWKRLNADEIIELPVEMSLFNRDDDLAVYKFKAETLLENPKTAAIKSLTLSEKPPVIGTDVISIGYYGEYQYPFNSFGSVSMIDVNQDIMSDITLMSGNSGGPLCDLSTGEVLGVNVSVMTLGNDVIRFGIAKPSAKLRALLKK